jgi:hypothetical protein
MTTETLSWREEIAQGRIPKVVPRDEREEANALIAARLLECTGCAWITNSLEINGERARVVSMMASRSSTAPVRRQIEEMELWFNNFQIDKDDGTDSIKLVLMSVGGTIVDGACEVDAGECVQDTGCSFVAELKFLAVSLNADPPAITINGELNAGHSPGTQPDVDGGSAFKREYTAYVTVSGTCGVSIAQDIGLGQLTFSVTDWTVNASQQTGNAPLLVKLSCDGCLGGESETD